MSKTQRPTAEEEYLTQAVAFQIARDSRDHKASNKAFGKLYAAARKIRSQHPDSGEGFFSKLLNHPMPHVVNFAAFNLIPVNPELARQAICRLAEGPPGEVRFNARMTLQEWDAGRLDPEWFMKP